MVLPILPWTAVHLLGGNRLIVGENPVNQAKEEDGETHIPILVNLVRACLSMHAQRLPRQCFLQGIELLLKYC